MLYVAVMFFAVFMGQSTQPAVLDSARAERDFDPSADPQSREWKDAPRVSIGLDYVGKALDGPPTEGRSRWTNEYL